MTASRYFRQGQKARRAREPRESCRFKAVDIVRDWTAGWDSEDAEIAAAAKEAARPRWGDATSRARGEWDKSATAWVLRGEAPTIYVFADMRRYGESLGPRAQSHGWGIEFEPLAEGADLSTPEAVQRAGIQAVRKVLLRRLAEIDAIADADGNLLTQPADPR